ncbi:STAS domain-containing protein [Streptacidiphilus sp. 4-A2]|nr:STAS domain-containing protein [Streptacidiphilus sp. 4-A2]
MTADPALAVLVLESGRTAEVLLSGELDVDADQVLRCVLSRILADPLVQRVELDVALVDFCDSGGLTALIRARTRAERFGVRLCLVRVGPQLRRILGMTGLWDLFDCTGVEDCL